MRVGLLGKKIGMTQVYDETGAVHVVTVVQAGPCNVLQVKTDQSDTYNAVQLGFEPAKPHRATQPAIGHAKKAGSQPCRFVREIRQEEAPDVEPGAVWTVDVFEDVPFVDVTGTSKGKGFAGGMKRHNFSGQLATHGVERKHRSPGSINGHATNLGTGGKPKKGKRMAGHMGDETVTTRNCRVVRIDKENNLLLIKGPLPGAKGGYLVIKKSKTAKAAS
jgi:large subunit ribosomal protein L3